MATGNPDVTTPPSITDHLRQASHALFSCLSPDDQYHFLLEMNRVLIDLLDPLHADQDALETQRLNRLPHDVPRA